MSKAFEELSAYHDDLSSRYEARKEWVARHPDYLSDLFQDEAGKYYDHGKPSEMVFQSSFDPSDLPPSTSDIFTTELMLNIVKVCLEAWEASHRG